MHLETRDFSKDKGAEIALVNIFANMMSIIIDRLNKVPEKNFIEFLDMLGMKILPPTAATVPITFYLIDGVSKSVLIPSKTQIASENVIFETEKNFYATPSKLVEIYSCDGDDNIFKCPYNVLYGETPSNLKINLEKEIILSENEITVDNPQGLEENDVLIVIKMDEKNIVSNDKNIIIDAKNGDEEIIVHDSQGIEQNDVLIIIKKDEKHNIIYQEYITVLLVNENEILLFDKLKNDYPKGSSVEKIIYEYITVSQVEENNVLLSDKLKNNFPIESHIEKLETFDIYNGKNLQKHILYMGHDSLFNFRNKHFNSNPNNGFKTILNIFFTFSNSSKNKSSETIEHIKLLEWEYWDGEKWEKLTEIGEPKDLNNSAKIDFLFTNKLPIIVKDINGINSFWIRCIGKKEYLKYIMHIHTSVDLVDYPDSCYYNNVPLNVDPFNTEKKIYPFGMEPKIYDNFYIANNNCFSKKNEKVKLYFNYEYDSQKEIPNTLFSFEYWNGKGWNALTDMNNLQFSEISGELSLIFTCPSDIEPIEVNGNYNYWVKFQLLNNIYKTIKNEDTFEIEYNPPSISKIKITKEPSKKSLSNILTFNDLEYRNLTSEESNPERIEPLKLFSSSYEEKAMYLGFDRKIVGGPISMFFSVEENEISFNNISQFKWKYFSKKGKWKILDLVDETFGLNREGTIEFLFPKDFGKTKKFGKKLYWIKAIHEDEIEDITEKNLPQIINKYLILKDKSLTSNGSDFLNIKNYFKSNYGSNTVLKKVLVNTTVAINSETIKNEVLGTSDGNKSQTFSLKKSPIISEEVWVNEINSISEVEINSIKNDKFLLFEEMKDIKGNVTDFWVKWENVSNIESSSNFDRHYEIDKFSKLIKFGNGINGLIPAMGNKIKVNYSVGGGSDANLAIESITDLKSSVPSISRVVNLIESSGGSDGETIEELMERAPNVLKHRNRGVSSYDVEKIVTRYFRNLSKVKCIPNMNNKGEFNKAGCISILAIPNTDAIIRPTLPLGVKKQIQNYLMNHAMNILDIQVLNPIYVEVNLTVVLTTIEIESIPEILEKANKILKNFLNPINGGYEGKGWEFGESPCLNDFYTILNNIYWVDYVKNVSMSLKSYENDEIISEIDVKENTMQQVDTGDGATNQNVSSKNISKINLLPYMIIYSGEHDITIEKSRERENDPS